MRGDPSLPGIGFFVSSKINQYITTKYQLRVYFKGHTTLQLFSGGLCADEATNAVSN